MFLICNKHCDVQLSAWYNVDRSVSSSQPDPVSGIAARSLASWPSLCHPGLWHPGPVSGILARSLSLRPGLWHPCLWHPGPVSGILAQSLASRSLASWPGFWHPGLVLLYPVLSGLNCALMTLIRGRHLCGVGINSHIIKYLFNVWLVDYVTVHAILPYKFFVWLTLWCDTSCSNK